MISVSGLVRSLTQPQLPLLPRLGKPFPFLILYPMPFADSPLFRHSYPVPQATPIRTRTPSPRSPMPKEIMRILRFGVVGGAGTFLNALLMWGLLSAGEIFLGLNPSGHRVATIAAFLAWIICCGTNFLLNAAWTFQAWPPTWKKAQHYYLSAALAFIFQILLLNFLLLLIQTDRPIETAVLNAVAVASGALLNYLFASLWVFRR